MPWRLQRWFRPWRRRAASAGGGHRVLGGPRGARQQDRRRDCESHVRSVEQVRGPFRCFAAAGPSLAVCAAPMRGRPARWLLIALWLALGGLIVLVGLVMWRTSTVGPARVLRREIEARAAARFLRPPQVQPPETGTFGERAARPWDALAALEAASADVEMCRAIREGEQPFEALTPSCRRELDASDGPLAALLLATHAAEAGPPPGLGTLDVPAPPERPRGWSTLPYAAKLGALRIRQLLATGEVAGAVRVCVDLLALARDASWGTGLAGRLPALAVERWRLPAVRRGARHRAGGREARRGRGAGPGGGGDAGVRDRARGVRARGPRAGVRSVPGRDGRVCLRGSPRGRGKTLRRGRRTGASPWHSGTRGIGSTRASRRRWRRRGCRCRPGRTGSMCSRRGSAHG